MKLPSTLIRIKQLSVVCPTENSDISPTKHTPSPIVSSTDSEVASIPFVENDVVTVIEKIVTAVEKLEKPIATKPEIADPPVIRTATPLPQVMTTDALNKLAKKDLLQLCSDRKVTVKLPCTRNTLIKLLTQ